MHPGGWATFPTYPSGITRNRPDRARAGGARYARAVRFLRLLLGASALIALLVLPACDGALDADAGPPPEDAARDAGPPPDAGPITCEPDTSGPVEAVFTLPRGGDDEAFFDLPWPTDLRRTEAGTVDMSAFPARRNMFVQRYLDAMTERLDGFGTNGAVYFRFSRPIDESALPTRPEQSLEASARVFLVDVDPDSPERGARHPIVAHYQDCPTRYWSAHTLAIRPVYGLPLASARTYAAVVTTDLRAADGEAFARSADLEALLAGSGDAAVVEAAAVHEPALTALEETGIARDTILSLAVFTTQDAIGETIAVRDWMHAEYPAPTVRTAEAESLAPRYLLVSGTYGPVPVFQAGEIPYSAVEDGGDITLDASGAPTVHGEYDARFTLTIPTSPMPETGYPIVLYAHGTGGDSRTVVRNDTAAALARHGIAAMGVDQIHHGDRNPTEVDPSILFFNIPNPLAARDNNRQSALDVVQQARLVEGLTFDVELVERDGMPVRFDPARTWFMGHSQGGLNGPIFMAIDDGASAGVLSAASAVITPSLIEKVQPLVIPEIVVALLNLPGRDYREAFHFEGFTVEHPIATLLQTWLEPSDASNYAHLVFQAPREGFAPKSVLMTEGLRDAFSPPTSIEALAGAMRVPQIRPVESALVSLRLAGIEPLDAPATGNVAGGAATAGLLQFPDDGHFAIFENADAEAQYLGFFESLVTGGPGTIPAP